MIRLCGVWGIVVWLGAFACTRPAEGREQRDFERMRQQQRYDLYEPSRFFRNGAVMQAPPAHTVPRSVAVNDSALSLGYLTGRDAAGELAQPPIPTDASTLERGRRQFLITCAVCHGAGGYGGGVMAPNLLPHHPPSLRTPDVQTMPAGTIFGIITNGREHMPAYGWQMPVAARWAVIAYVRALRSQPATAATLADSARAEHLARLDSAHTLEARWMVPEPGGGGWQ